MKLVHFTAEWCQPCKTMQPVIDEFINENQDLDYIRIDIEKDRELFDEYNVNRTLTSVPTFYAMSGDQLLKTQVGATTKDGLANLFV